MISKRKRVLLLSCLLGLGLLLLLNLYFAPLVARAGLIALNRMGFENVSFALSTPTFTRVTLRDFTFQRRIDASRLLVAKGLTVELAYDPLRALELTSVVLTGGVCNIEPTAFKEAVNDRMDVLTVIQGLPLKKLVFENVALVLNANEQLLISGGLSKSADKSLNGQVKLQKGVHQVEVTASSVNHALTAHTSYSIQKRELVNSELRGQIDANSIQLRGPINIKTGTHRDSGEMALLHSFADGVGELTVSTKQIPAAELVGSFSGMIPQLIPTILPSRGSVSLDISQHWGGRQGAEGTLEVQDLDITFDALSLIDLDSRLPLRWNGKALDAPDATIRIAKVDFGVSVTDVTAAFSVTDPALQLKSAKATALGGTVSAGPANFSAEASAWALPVEFHGVSLEQLMQLYPQEKIAASGSIGGSFVLSRSHDGISIEDGQLAAEEPGGTIKYLSMDAADQGQVSEPISEIALGALTNFRYDTLKAGIALLPSGELGFKTQMAGSNPSWQGGRRVEFNINLQQNLHDLLHSLRLTTGNSSELKNAVNGAMSSK